MTNKQKKQLITKLERQYWKVMDIYCRASIDPEKDQEWVELDDALCHLDQGIKKVKRALCI